MTFKGSKSGTGEKHKKGRWTVKTEMTLLVRSSSTIHGSEHVEGEVTRSYITLSLDEVAGDDGFCDDGELDCLGDVLTGWLWHLYPWTAVIPALHFSVHEIPSSSCLMAAAYEFCLTSFLASSKESRV
jgi:hypothetical protein